MTSCLSGLILVMSLAGPSASSQQAVENRLPPLHVTDWIQGRAADVGPWGDGKVYVLDLWGTWCAPCIANIPELTWLQAKYGERGLVVIGYSWEEPAKLKPCVAKMGEKMKYVVVTDTKEVTIGELTRREMVESFPYAFLIDRAGTVVWRGHPTRQQPGGSCRSPLRPLIVVNRQPLHLADQTSDQTEEDYRA